MQQLQVSLSSKILRQEGSNQVKNQLPINSTI